jgi:hypothetical protein
MKLLGPNLLTRVRRSTTNAEFGTPILFTSFFAESYLSLLAHQNALSRTFSHEQRAVVSFRG